MNSILTAEKLVCFHCGDDCRNDKIRLEDKLFCCEGCKTVYEILSSKDLCAYYNFEGASGVKKNNASNNNQFASLDEPSISDKILNFKEGNHYKVTFYIPKIHCTSCIWLLEHLSKMNEGVVSSRINFLKKELSISFNSDVISLRHLAELIDSLGYTPQLNLDKFDSKETKTDYSLIYKIGIAGFCFGNIMMLSFPDYLSVTRSLSQEYSNFFGVINLILALPVVFYAGSGYFISAWNGLKNKIINIDFPIALSLVAVFGRSVYEVYTYSGLGYFDSLAGLVFFLLIGKWYQRKTYDALSFEKDYKSYFPLAVSLIREGELVNVPVSQLKKGDRILVRNQELIPADCTIVKGNANIDYSFVTGESVPLEKQPGDKVYAGGKQIGSSIELVVRKDVQHSYFTQLWNQDVFKKDNRANLQTFANKVGKVFTIAILVVAFSTFFYWYRIDHDTAFRSAISVLIVFCPCVLTLAMPFAFGNTLRKFGSNGFFMKSKDSVETMANIDTVVFDKTGTLTEKESKAEFIGLPLTEEEEVLVCSVAAQTMHPLSQSILKSISSDRIIPVTTFTEKSGGGIEAELRSVTIKMGSSIFVVGMRDYNENDASTKVFLSINGTVKGYFRITHQYRLGIEKLIVKLNKHFDIHLLSGDNDAEMEHLSKLLPKENIHFNQTPFDKLSYIAELKESGSNVLMVGDGLNDAGALKQSDLGITVVEDIYNFSPACDAILDAKSLGRLSDFINFSKISCNTVKISLAISLLYNVIGLYFAVSGRLKPLIAAIIMPLSSVSVVLFVTLTILYFAHKRKL